jgi:PilZ domain-containing protein
MSQIFEALRQAEAVRVARNWRQDVEMAVVERRESDRQTMAARIRIYGHGQGLSPFFEENSILNASDTGALLLMRAPVVAGQKLLLINEAAEQVQECRVVRTACRESMELEVAVEFPNPQPQFWSRLGRQDEEQGIEKRKRPRITLPRGMDVTWRGRGESVLSRVQTISSGGLSIAAPEPPPVGELVHVSFEVPAGEVSARAVVRHSRGREGMGIEFVAMSDEARNRLDQLLHKLLS